MSDIGDLDSDIEKEKEIILREGSVQRGPGQAQATEQGEELYGREEERWAQ